MAYRASKVVTAYIIIFLLATLSTYGLAVGLGHISPFVPFLGFLGDSPLESTVFTQFFVIVACALAVVIQVHYVSVSTRLKRNDSDEWCQWASAAGLYAGYASASGLFVLACFQESHAYYVHHIAEGVYLLGGVLYAWLHTFISKREKDANTGMRMVLSFFMTVFFVIFLASYVVAVRSFDQPWDDRYHWKRDDAGWLAYIFSAASEWIIITLFHCFLLTCCSDLQFTLITKTAIHVVHEDR